MPPEEFLNHHRPALEADEAKHNLILAILNRLQDAPTGEIRYWHFGVPGQCAVQAQRFAIVLAELSDMACRSLADLTRNLDYPGILGPDSTSVYFVERARELGLQFGEPIPLQIYALDQAPRYPGAPGSARLVSPKDGPLFAEWMTAFYREVTPHEIVPSREHLMALARGGHHLFWAVRDEPVSMAGIQRRSRSAAAISGVYTPPEFRGHGYAGCVTAAAVDRIFAEGKKTACLYTHLRSPVSNRCYQNIGFQPVCSSLHYLRM